MKPAFLVYQSISDVYLTAEFPHNNIGTLSAITTAMFAEIEQGSSLSKLIFLQWNEMKSATFKSDSLQPLLKNAFEWFMQIFLQVLCKMSDSDSDSDYGDFRVSRRGMSVSYDFLNQ